MDQPTQGASGTGATWWVRKTEQEENGEEEAGMEVVGAALLDVVGDDELE